MTVWTAADIAREFGLSSPAVARSWIRRAGVEPLPERRGEAKLYDSGQVRAAREAMVGQGKGGGRRPRS